LMVVLDGPIRKASLTECKDNSNGTSTCDEKTGYSNGQSYTSKEEQLARLSWLR